MSNDEYTDVLDYYLSARGGNKIQRQFAVLDVYTSDTPTEMKEYVGELFTGHVYPKINGCVISHSSMGDSRFVELIDGGLLIKIKLHEGGEPCK